MGPVPRVRCATLGYGVEHLRRSGIQDWGQPPEDDCDSLLRALRVLRGSFPVLPRLQVSVDCPRQIISFCLASGAGVSFLVQGIGREALELLVFSWAYQLHL